MKKILSILLALTLIIGLVPTAFAEGENAPTTVTYKFYGKDSAMCHTGIDKDRLEVAAGTVKYFTAFPEPVSGEDNRLWAYLGTSVSKPYDNNRFVAIFENYFATSSETKAGEWLAFKIKVP